MMSSEYIIFIILLNKKDTYYYHSSHLSRIVEARLAELLIIFPVAFVVPVVVLHVQVCGKSVRALGDTKLGKATHPLNDEAHRNYRLKRQTAA